MNSISSSSGSYQTAVMQGMGGPRGRPKPEASDVAAQIFSKLDTDKQGYLEASDFTSAISQLSSSQQQASGEEVFSSLDSDSDGKLTQDELTTGIQALQDQLDSQFNAMRVQQGMGGMNGMPPPPPPGGGRGGQGQDEGFDQEQLSLLASAAEEAGDSRGASMFSELADNFDEADADGDGKVTFSESVAYREQQQQQASSEDSSSDTSTASASSSTSLSQEMQSRIAQRLMDMMRAYDDKPRNSTASSRFAA
ncbi:MAG: EF-hand domain-containing protein [Vogesella sp.]|uniref:EF-hand domain-containing protein n=1 Tax=Vogesella sp. TaxID=1904252 RepID=UPI00391DE790